MQIQMLQKNFQKVRNTGKEMTDDELARLVSINQEIGILLQKIQEKSV